MSTEMSEDEGKLLNLSKAGTGAKLINPAIHRRLFTETERRMFVTR